MKMLYRSLRNCRCILRSHLQKRNQEEKGTLILIESRLCIYITS